MTTPVPDIFDWAQLMTNIQDVNSARFAHRLIEMQRQTLDSQVAQLAEVSKQFEQHIQKMEELGKG